MISRYIGVHGKAKCSKEIEQKYSKIDIVFGWRFRISLIIDQLNYSKYKTLYPYMGNELIIARSDLRD